MKVVIVGGGAGGISTASNIRKLDKDIEITVLTRDNKVAYSPCAIPLVLGGCIESFDDIIMHDVAYYSKKNIQVHLSTSVVDVDSSNKKITFEKDSNTQTISYDKLVLATGSEIVCVDFDIDDMGNIATLANVEDGRIIQESIKDKKDIVFISNFSIGIESAYELAKRGYNVTFLEQSSTILPLFLDVEMSEKLVELNGGVNFETNVNISGITSNASKKIIHYNDKMLYI